MSTNTKGQHDESRESAQSQPIEHMNAIASEGFLRETFRLLNDSGLRYVVPRNWHDLPGRVGKDLDVLLPAQDLWPAVMLIRETASRLGFASVVRNDDGQGLGVDVITLLDDASSIAVSFDLRSLLSFRAFRSDARGRTYKVFADQLQQRAVSVNGCEIEVLKPIDEFICLYFQYQVKRSLGIEHKIQEYSVQLEALMTEPEVASWLREASGESSSNDIRSRAFAPNEWQVFGLSLLNYRWGRMNLVRLLASQLRASLISLRFRWPRLAPIVYFSGPDGAGKTTLTNGVKARFDSCGVKFTYLYSLKILIRGVTKRLAFIKRIGRRKPVHVDCIDPGEVPDILFLTEDTRDRDTGSAFWRFRKLMALLVGIVDIWIGWCYVLLFRLRGRVVLIETAPYDIFIKYHMPEFPGIESVLGPLIPRPSIGFLLQAEPWKIVERKAELTVEEIADYYTRFEQVFERCHARDSYRIVRTEIEPQKTAALVLGLVLSSSN